MNKVKVLALVNGYYTSHTVRVLEIARGLRDTGRFDIVFSGNGPYMKWVNEAGFEWIPAKVMDISYLISHSDEKGIHWYDSKETVDMLYEEECRALDMVRPDMIIRDDFRELAALAAKVKKVFDVSITQVNLSSFYHYDFVPVHMVTGEAGKDMAPEDANRFVILGKRQYYKYIYQKLEELGLERNSINEMGVEPDLTLFADSYKIFPTFGLSEKKYKYIGPLLVYNQNPPPPWKEEFIQSDLKKIIITSGTSGVLDIKGVAAKIFDPGKYTIAIQEDNVPEGIYGGKFEIKEILSHADLFITHGGLGSMYMGLKAGVPMICIYTHLEQQVNAYEVSRLGIGADFHNENVSAEVLRESIEELLNNSEKKKRAEKISKTLTEDNAVVLSVHYITGAYESFSGTKIGEKADTMNKQEKDTVNNTRDADFLSAEAELAMTDAPVLDKTKITETKEVLQADKITGRCLIPNPKEDVITIKELKKSFGQVTAVDGIEFSVKRGEIFGLLGPNGAGKSTTIDLITGLKKRSGGSISILGMNPDREGKKIKEKVGIQLQDVRLFSHLNVEETVELFRSFYTSPLDTGEILSIVGLTDKKKSMVNQLSGGQLQRVGIAIALVGNGEIIFLDEPTAGLDPQTRRMLWEVIENLKQNNKTVFLTTHFMDEAEKLCDRVAIMNSGKIIAMDTPKHLIEYYCNESAVEIPRMEGKEYSFLNNLVGVSRIQETAEFISLYTSNITTLISELIETAKRTENNLGDFTVHTATLEDVFLKLAGRRILE